LDPPWPWIRIHKEGQSGAEQRKLVVLIVTRKRPHGSDWSMQGSFEIQRRVCVRNPEVGGQKRAILLQSEEISFEKFRYHLSYCFQLVPISWEVIPRQLLQLQKL
jgi:hypothetical protein